MGVGVHYKKLLSRYQFCENWHNDNYSLLKGIHEFLLMIFISRLIWMIFIVEDLHIMSSYEFCGNCCSKSHTLQMVIN